MKCRKQREFQTRSVCAVHLFYFSISFDHINGFSATSVRCRPFVYCVCFTTATIATNSIIPGVHGYVISDNPTTDGKYNPMKEIKSSYSFSFSV